MIKVLSYHNKPELKEWAVNMAENHYKMDMLVTGTYGNVEDDTSFKGCSVGCDARDICGSTVNPHSTTSQYFGFPEWLERLRDTLFEGLDAKSRKTFHVDFKKAIPVGVDLEPVRHQLAIARLGSLLKLYEDNDSFGIKSALTLVIRCHEAELNRQVCDWSAAESAALSAAELAWSAAWSAAESAAWSVRSAALSAAESAAESAALSVRSAALSVRSAAESAAESAAWSVRSAAESAAYKQEAKMLIKLLSECK